jgi:hypothetical protein
MLQPLRRQGLQYLRHLPCEIMLCLAEVLGPVGIVAKIAVLHHRNTINDALDFKVLSVLANGASLYEANNGMKAPHYVL